LIYWFKRPDISGTPKFLSAVADSKELIGAAKVRVKIELEKRSAELKRILAEFLKYAPILWLIFKKRSHPVSWMALRIKFHYKPRRDVNLFSQPAYN